MVISGFPSPLLNVYVRAAPKGTAICPIVSEQGVMAQLLSHTSEPVVFVCANYQVAENFFNAIPAGQFFGNFHGKKTLVFADASKPFWQDLAHYPIPYVDAYATPDCAESPLNPKKWVPDVFTPILRSEWASPAQEKPVDLAFYGSVRLYKERAETVDYLRKEGILVESGGGQEDGYAMDFLGAMRKAKLTLNFSNCQTAANGLQIHHIKGRVWEAAMCRTVIIETRNPATQHFFTDDEIVWYDNKKELPHLIRDLLADNERRSSITEKMFNKAAQYTDPDNYWKKFE